MPPTLIPSASTQYSRSSQLSSMQLEGWLKFQTAAELNCFAAVFFGQCRKSLRYQRRVVRAVRKNCAVDPRRIRGAQGFRGEIRVKTPVFCVQGRGVCSGRKCACPCTRSVENITQAEFKQRPDRQPLNFRPKRVECMLGKGIATG